MKKNIENYQSSRPSNWPLYLSIFFLGGMIMTYFFVPAVQDFFREAWQILSSEDEQKIQHWISRFGWFAPVFLFLAMVFQMFLLVIPTLLLMIVSILAFGPFWGSILIFVSVFAASSVGYFIGRYSGQMIIDRLIGQKSKKKMEGFLKKYGFWAIIITRINPFLSNDAISFAGGLLRMSYWKFIAATLAGITPLILYIAIISRDTDTLKTGLLWGSIISLMVFVGYVWWDKKRRHKSV